MASTSSLQAFTSSEFTYSAGSRFQVYFSAALRHPFASPPTVACRICSPTVQTGNSEVDRSDRRRALESLLEPARMRSMHLGSGEYSRSAGYRALQDKEDCDQTSTRKPIAAVRLPILASSNGIHGRSRLTHSSSRYTAKESRLNQNRPKPRLLARHSGCPVLTRRSNASSSGLKMSRPFLQTSSGKEASKSRWCSSSARGRLTAEA